VSEDKPDRVVISCNYREGTNVASPGARAYLVGGINGDGGERRIFLVRSRSGRWVRKWEPVSRMTNFRRKTIPAEHPLYDRLSDGAFMSEWTGEHLILFNRLNQDAP